MPHSSRVRVIHPAGYYSFSSRKQCENLRDMNRGHFEDLKTFRLYEHIQPKESASGDGEMRVKSTETGATLKYQTGPAFPTRQWERK